jgi:hypothetical protein
MEAVRMGFESDAYKRRLLSIFFEGKKKGTMYCKCDEVYGLIFSLCSHLTQVNCVQYVRTEFLLIGHVQMVWLRTLADGPQNLVKVLLHLFYRSCENLCFTACDFSPILFSFTN